MAESGSSRCSCQNLPVTIVALLATLVFIFAFQADNITGRYLHVVLIAIPNDFHRLLSDFLKKALRRFREHPLRVVANGDASFMSKSGKRPKRGQP